MAEDSSCTKQFADAGHDGERAGVAQAHAQTVQRGVYDAVLVGERFRTAQDDAVHYDQGHVQTQGLIQVGQVGLQQHLQNRYERRDNNDVARDADLIGNDLLQRGNEDVGEEQYEGYAQSHTDAVGGHGGYCQRGAGTQDQDQDRVFLDKTVGKDAEFALLVFH